MAKYLHVKCPLCGVPLQTERGAIAINSAVSRIITEMAVCANDLCPVTSIQTKMDLSLEKLAMFINKYPDCPYCGTVLYHSSDVPAICPRCDKETGQE